MKRTVAAAALLVVSAMTISCGLDIFEDIGTDPHPPTVEIISLGIYVAPVEEAPAATTDAALPLLRGRSATWDSGGFSLSEGQLFQITIAYSDAGGDIERFRLRDRDGATSLDLTPVDSTYFSGTSGIAFGPETGQELTGIVGPHRLELWAEDSHGSRSEKIEFTITLPLL